MTTPKVFISYSHDSASHKAWVLTLAENLVGVGIDVTLDQWDLSVGQDVTLFMENGISSADRVLMICSSAYVSKAEAGSGGVGYERLIVTAEMVRSIDTNKFIPLLRGSDPVKRVPKFLGTRLYVNFENDAEYQERFTDLAREIHGAPAVTKPPLGTNPFSGTPVAGPSRTPGAIGAPSSPTTFLNSSWFSQESAKARGGISNLGLNGEMELRFAILPPIAQSQKRLLDAVRKSEIRTFGWPIAILLENTDEFRPRPHGDAIRAEVSLQGTKNDRTSYDYWALRTNGDFYLLQSLFEDTRVLRKIFFDTRIVRVTESLMLMERVYQTLGADPDTLVGIRVAHRGLKDRTLESASSYRVVFPRQTKENENAAEITTKLGTMKQTRVKDVRDLLDPLFVLFDYQEFDASIFHDIITNFENGKIR